MTPAAPFGPYEFQLVLLRRMADHQPGLVEDALRELGRTRGEMREANRVWQSWAHARRGPGEYDRYRQVLGEPVARQAAPEFASEVLQWDLPLWPDLRWEVVVGGQGRSRQVWARHLTRRPGAPVAAPRSEAELLPWSCTFAEVRRAFPDAVPREGDAPTRARLDLVLPGGVARTADFTWGLLQELR
ncbi:hypothetical protein ACIGEZ_03345 [Streptomyces sp. NPDC085481]|uniref:hypothetical protein n=1 Tax=Streptomyces sp. NPDC085481 TaxID=3365727 RepID=UPI0037CF87EB